MLLEALHQRWPGGDLTLHYAELDPDIFSEDLDQPGYEEVEGIAAIGLVVTRTPARAAPISGSDPIGG